MASYPTYRVADVHCSDPSGRWDLLPGTDVLPSFPGRRVTNWTVPGQVGNRSAAYAPGEATVVTLEMRFNAVAGSANKIPVAREARLRAIRDNLDLFLQTTAVARSGYLGLVQLRLYMSATDYRVINGRMVTASRPEWAADADHATVSFKFECPAGVWRSPSKVVTKSTIKKSATSTKIKVKGGTAPSVSNMVCIKGPLTSTYGSRLTITNGHGQGFKLGLKGMPVSIPSGSWLLINTETWRCGLADRYDDWGVGKANAGWIEPRGRPMGSALTILPEVEKDVGWVHVWTPKANTEVVVRSDRAWY